MAPPVSRRSREDRTAPSADRYRKAAVDDDEDESPRARRRRERDEDPEPRSRRAKDDDDDDDEPRGRSRRSRHDEVEDDDEDEPPARGRRSRREEAEEKDEKKPSRRSRRSSRDDDDDDDEPRGRRSRDDDEDEDEEERSRKGSSAGWKAFKKKRATMGTFTNDLKVPDDDSILIKIMDDEPFASFGQHWVMTKNGLRSHTCLEDRCPLCDKLGDSPRPVGAFNVLLLDEQSEPTLWVWAAGPLIAGILEKKSAAKTGPLTKEYYEVSKSKSGGKKGSTQYHVDVVRSRDLKEEWGIAPLRDSELDKWDAKLLTEEKYVKYSTRAELNALARELMDDED